MIDRIAEIIRSEDGEMYWVYAHGQPYDYRALARAIVASMREPTHAIIRAMAESRARDDESEFEPLMDLIDFSGENKTHTVLKQAWRDAVDAVLRDADNA